MIYYTVYKVTNKLSGKFYIGTHKTTNLDDNYYGSGKYLKRAIEKHGIENFEKEILHVFDNPEDMFDKEAEIVDEDFLAEENTYNLRIGGFGGWDYVNSIGLNVGSLSKEQASKGAKSLWNRFRTDSEFEEQYRNKRREIAKRVPGFVGAFKGKQHTKESKKKIADKLSQKQKGSGNSQYGTRWIHSLVEKRSKRIKKDDPLPEGWLEGRKMKFT